MLHKDTDITITVKENVVETSNYRSIVFVRPKGFEYESGGWIDIQFIGKKLTGGITYSLSSSPTEPDLMITFKDGFSEIKKALAASKKGDKLRIIQHGNQNKFSLKQHHTSTLIAGGVGIAPFRSMLKEKLDLNETNEVNLIYLNKTSNFIFNKELELWRNQLDGLNITYIMTEGLKGKDRIKLLFDAIKITDSTFHIAGPESMVESTEHLLLDSGVDLKDIKIDSFSGYQ